MANPKTSSVPKTHHYIRTPVAAFFGTLALLLISASILVVWANRTLTDTNTYVATVGPVLGQPALQDYVATQVTNQLLSSATLPQLESNLLTPAQVAGKTPGQLHAELTPVIHDSVVQVLQAPQVQAAWKSTNQNAQADLIRQLNANDPTITINFGPLVSAVLAEMKQTKLAPVANQINLQPSQANVTLPSDSLKKVHNGYNILRTAPLVILLLTLVFVALSIWISAHHAKTLRRILVSTGVSALAVAAVIALPRFVQLPSSDPASARVAVNLTATLLHGLQLGCVVLGVACVVLAIGSKVYDHIHGRG